MRGAVAALLVALLVAGCATEDADGAMRCSPNPEDTNSSMTGTTVQIDAEGVPHFPVEPPIKRGKPFSLSVYAAAAPDAGILADQGADLAVRDIDGHELYRTHADVDPEWRDQLRISFDLPCFLGASYAFEYAGHSIPLGIPISDAAACSDRSSPPAQENAFLYVNDGLLDYDPDWPVGPQPFVAQVRWIPEASQELREEGASIVVRIDGEVVDTVVGLPLEASTFALWFEPVPCIVGADYTLEYPGHVLEWRPYLVD